jgi:hypothetical protein
VVPGSRAHREQVGRGPPPPAEALVARSTPCAERRQDVHCRTGSTRCPRAWPRRCCRCLTPPPRYA